MQNLPINDSKNATAAVRKALNLTETNPDAAPNYQLEATFEQESELVAARIENQTNYIEPLIGDSDPASTPFGVKHFWYKF